MPRRATRSDARDPREFITVYVGVEIRQLIERVCNEEGRKISPYILHLVKKDMRDRGILRDPATHRRLNIPTNSFIVAGQRFGRYDPSHESLCAHGGQAIREILRSSTGAAILLEADFQGILPARGEIIFNEFGIPYGAFNRIASNRNIQITLAGHTTAITPESLQQALDEFGHGFNREAYLGTFGANPPPPNAADQPPPSTGPVTHRNATRLAAHLNAPVAHGADIRAGDAVALSNNGATVVGRVEHAQLRSGERVMRVTDRISLAEDRLIRAVRINSAEGRHIEYPEPMTRDQVQDCASDEGTPAGAIRLTMTQYFNRNPHAPFYRLDRRQNLSLTLPGRNRANGSMEPDTTVAIGRINRINDCEPSQTGGFAYRLEIRMSVDHIPAANIAVLNDNGELIGIAGLWDGQWLYLCHCRPRFFETIHPHAGLMLGTVQPINITTRGGDIAPVEEFTITRQDEDASMLMIRLMGERWMYYGSIFYHEVGNLVGEYLGPTRLTNQFMVNLEADGNGIAFPRTREEPPPTRRRSNRRPATGPF